MDKLFKLIYDDGLERQEIDCATEREAHHLGALAIELGCDCYEVHVDGHLPIICYEVHEIRIPVPISTCLALPPDPMD
jgi:hypothetical protein